MYLYILLLLFLIVYQRFYRVYYCENGILIIHKNIVISLLLSSRSPPFLYSSRLYPCRKHRARQQQTDKSTRTPKKKKKKFRTQDRRSRRLPAHSHALDVAAVHSVTRRAGARTHTYDLHTDTYLRVRSRTHALTHAK